MKVYVVSDEDGRVVCLCATKELAQFYVDLDDGRGWTEEDVLESFPLIVGGKARDRQGDLCEIHALMSYQGVQYAAVTYASYHPCIQRANTLTGVTR